MPFPIAAGIVTEPSRMPLASVVNVLSSFGVEKAHTSTEEFALKPDAKTLTAAPALTVALPASIVTSVVAGNTMHKAPATKGLATVVEATVVEVVVAPTGTLEHTRTPCGVAATTASTEVPSAEVTRPLPDSAAGAVGETKGVFAATAVVVAPAFTVVELAGAVVEDVVVEDVVVEDVVVVAAVVVGAVVEDVVVVAAVVVGAVVEDVVVEDVVVVSATVVAGSTVEACAIPSCAKPAMPMAPARRRTLVARVVECVMSYSFRHVQVRTAKERHDLAVPRLVVLRQSLYCGQF